MLDILLYGASLLLEFAALVILRLREPDMPRPFRVPGGLSGAILCAAGPAALLVFALIRNRSEQIELGRFGTISTLTFGLGLMALGVVYYAIAGRPKTVVAEVVGGD